MMYKLSDWKRQRYNFTPKKLRKLYILTFLRDSLKNGLAVGDRFN